jgi:omega-amidase
MRVVLIQPDLKWQDPGANRQNLQKLMDGAQPADIYVLPEMFTSGFTMEPATVAESMTGLTVTWLQNMAAQKQAAICGSMVVSENSAFRNRFLFVKPDRSVSYYDKRHLFSLAGEDKVYEPGKEKVIVSYMGWNICLQVCYDLRFPAFARNVEDYDLLVYVANWPGARIQAWDTLLKARAIENMSFVIGVNRVGVDANGHDYPGHSQAIDFMGHELAAAEEQEQRVFVDLDRDAMLKAREKFGFLRDRDQVTVR